MTNEMILTEMELSLVSAADGKNAVIGGAAGAAGGAAAGAAGSVAATSVLTGVIASGSGGAVIPMLALVPGVGQAAALGIVSGLAIGAAIGYFWD